MYNGKLGIRDFFVALLDETGSIGVVEEYASGDIGYRSIRLL
jgi:hypothetical protein